MNLKIQQIQGQSYSDMARREYIHQIQLQCQFELSDKTLVTNKLTGAVHPDALVDVKAYVEDYRDRGNT